MIEFHNDMFVPSSGPTVRFATARFTSRAVVTRTMPLPGISTWFPI
jgi:hypothetical protein